jgi:hypothetical protein
MNKGYWLMIFVMSGKPYGNTKAITNVFGMLHAKFDRFEIFKVVMPNLITIYQREMRIVENKLNIGRQKLMCVD